MLTQEEKDKIKAEEIFRYEIQKDLKKSNKPKKSIWNFINSAFGLWLLSSVFLGFLTYQYNQWNEGKKTSDRRSRQVRKLDIEIYRRVMILNGEVDHLLSFQPDSTEDDPDRVFSRNLEKSIRKMNSKTDYVFEDFRKRKLSSLLFELYSLAEDKDRPMLETTFSNVFRIEQMTSAINKRTSLIEAKNMLKSITEYTKESLSLQKWKPEGSEEL